jgi:glutathione S-transferase
LNFGIPFANLPYIIHEGNKIAESNAVFKYIARRFKPDLMGKTLADKGLHETILFFNINLFTTVMIVVGNKEATDVAV